MMSVRRVMVVEDEPLIAMMLEDFLEILGYEMAGIADCASEAIDTIETGAPDAAILDVNLRGGEKCWPIADALVRRNIPFVLASGGSTDVVPEEHRDSPMLTKPYSMEAIRQALVTLE